MYNNNNGHKHRVIFYIFFHFKLQNTRAYAIFGMCCVIRCRMFCIVNLKHRIGETHNFAKVIINTPMINNKKTRLINDIHRQNIYSVVIYIHCNFAYNDPGFV